MSVTIENIEPQGLPPVHHGFAVIGKTSEPCQNVQVYYEILLNGVQSPNMPAVSDARCNWSVVFPGDFKVGSEVTAFARNGSAELARFTRMF